MNGVPSSGGGGGGVGYLMATGGSGGSGVVIFRYKKPIEATRVVDYVKNGSPALTDYKVGMVNGDFRIQGIKEGYTQDRFMINDNTGMVSLANRSLKTYA